MSDEAAASALEGIYLHLVDTGICRLHPGLQPLTPGGRDGIFV